MLPQKKAVARALRSYYRNEISYTQLLQQLPLRATDPLLAEISGYGIPASARIPSYTINEDWLEEHIERIFDIINRLDPPPPVIGNADVILYSEIDRRHRATSGKIYFRVGGSVRRICGVAICKESEGEYYLFGCDENWETITDSEHSTIEEAQDHAESDYENVGHTWRSFGAQVR